MTIRLYLIFLLICILHASFTNTTDFWKKAPTQEIYYQTYSGYEEINWYYPPAKSGMFYNMFTSYGHNSVQPDSRIPLIFWLQGGPGASSQFGAFTENGPIRITKDGLKQNRYSWNIIGHMVYIDQPLGVGFSYLSDKNLKRISSSRQVADHLLNFLYNFYKQWPALKQSPLYISGQSYAGHYIPAFATKLKSNTTFLNELKIDFKGIIIGDGWTDPYNQVNQYDSLLYSIGVGSNKLRDLCTWYQTQSIHNIMLGRYFNSTLFINFLMNDNNTDSQNRYFGGMNVFNFRTYGDQDFSFETYMNENKKFFGVPDNVSFVVINDSVQDDFTADLSRSYAGDVAWLLKNNVKILIYNGQDDFIVNTPGVSNYLNSLNWQGIASWKRTRKQIWTTYGQVKGWAKVYNNLWFVFVNHAGHMVPADQPEAAFNMLGHFISDNKDWKE